MENNKIKITRKQLGEIYPNVCRSWQSKINEVLAENRFDDTLEVDNEILLKAYSESYEGHRIWLDSVTGGINNLKPKYVWVKRECKGKIIIEQHPEKQLRNLMFSGWEKLTQSDLERIKKEI